MSFLSGKKTIVIAEAGVNHNGSLDLAKKLCLKAKDAGANVVKFQTWKTEKIITKNVKKAEYQIENTKKQESQFDMLKKLELSYEQFTEIKKYCDDIGIVFASTADDLDSLDFLVSLGIPFIKIGSGEMCNVPYLRYVGSKGLPIILSTGMSTISDIGFSIDILKKSGAKEIYLLHCTTSYPCPFDKVNLNAMDTLRKEFGLPVGYSDHTKGIEIPIAAVAKGARIIEKHFTLDCTMDGPDHVASTEPIEFKKMIDSIRNVETGLGSGIKKPSPEEIDISKLVLKKIVASKAIEVGSVFTEDNLTVKRSEKGISAKEWDNVVGKVATRNYDADEGIDI